MVELSTEQAKSWIRNQWQIPLLFGVMLVTALVRLQYFTRFYSASGFAFSEPSTWYRVRRITYTANNWPSTLKFDPWVGFPEGVQITAHNGVLDQFLAVIPAIVGFGEPTTQLTAAVVLVLPPIAAGMTIIPVYLIGRQLYGKKVGVSSAVVLSVLPGAFFARTLSGVTPTQSIAVLLLCTSVYFVVKSLNELKKYEITLEDYKDVNSFVLRPTLNSAVTAAIVTAILCLVWPVGILFVSVAGAALAVIVLGKIYLDERVQEIGLFGFVYGFVVSGILLVSFLLTPSDELISVVLLSSAHIIVPASILLCSIPVLVSNRLPAGATPVSAFVLLSSSLFVLWKLVPVAGGSFSQDFVQLLFTNYGLLPGIGVLGAIVSFGLSASKNRSDLAYVSVFGLSLIGLTVLLPQFSVYLAPFVALLVPPALYWVFSLFSIPSQSPELTTYQYIVIGIVFLVFIPTIAAPYSGTVVGDREDHTAGEYTTWDETVDWMEKNTPKEPLSSHGDYSSDRFEYPEDSYSVLTWGVANDWITVGGERISVGGTTADNQQTVANLLTSPASEIKESTANPKYIVLSRPMMLPQEEFSVIASRSDSTAARYFLPLYNSQDGSLTGTIKRQSYYESTIYQLYAANGGELRSEPVVVNWDTRQVSDGGVLAVTDGNSTIREYSTRAAAERFVQNDSSSQIGGVNGIPSETVPAVENYRLVHGSTETVADTNASSVKVFERVPGAVVSGTGPKNETIIAQIRLQTQSGRSFSYTQSVTSDADGSFNLRVPYATTEYDSVGVSKGYANVSTRAVGPLRVQSVVNENGSATVYQGATEVPEPAVTSGKTVSLEMNPVNQTE